ncbi:MAG: serine/threonine protein kinase [Anaerolineales bacterium]|nr:serine/threonine protein kinase [Anaerolineales bacterium]
MAFTNGQNVGPYRILEQLGQGGMATVYKAYHAGLDRYVAIKVLHAAFREDPSFTARFTREARVVAKLEHPNIVPIYDYSEYEGQPYLVMKFIEGETLKSRLAHGPLSATEAVRVIQTVGAALAYAHSKGILHRDIKPSNVLLTPEGGIYLADFGLARIAQSGESTLSTDMMLGTPHYISPEQAQGVKNLDAGTDIYSLGVVMYELSVGRVPFNADTPFSIIHDHIFTPLPLPRAINPKVPAAVERVLLKALAKDRKDRYADVDSLVGAFQDAVREVTTVAAVPAKASVSTVKLAAPPPAAAGKARAGAGAVKPPAGARLPLWRRVPKWLLILLVLMACGCTCTGAFLMLGAAGERQNQRATQTALAASALTPVMQTPVRPATMEGKLTQEPQAAQDFIIPEDLREAWKRFEQGLAFLNEGNQAAADKEFITALDMLPADRTGVIILAVQKLNARGQWIMSAQYLQKGLDKSPNDTDLRAASAEVLFQVAGIRDAEPLVRWFVERIPRWAISQGAMGRWLTLWSPSPKDGEPFIRDGMEIARGEEKPFVRAIMGEHYCVTGNTAEGISLMKEVMSDPNLPPWLRVELERMIEKWQPK